ncbi:MAG: AAA family ATPase [Nannocystaceae bacterium]|nr:AAA family ATPase [Nannocystaceae bacterium]
MNNSDGKAHFIRTLTVLQAFAVQDLEISVGTEEAPRHLLLTGPNGSGKSTILSALQAYLLNPQIAGGAQIRSIQSLLQGARGQVHTLPEAHASVVRQLTGQLETLKALPAVETQPAPQAPVPRAETLLIHAPAIRTLRLNQPTGPARLETEPFVRGVNGAPFILQYLVNLRSEGALAREDGDNDVADAIAARLAKFEDGLGSIFSDPGLKLVFNRSTWRYSVQFGDGRDVGFDQLPDGFSSIVYLWSSLLLAAEGLRRQGITDPEGWALLDEPELHLHAELQERILPFLCSLFPRVQFIVATHSPAVLASLAGATVFDLASREAYVSEDLHGIRYGTIFTEHFGIETDFDVATTAKLKRLGVLYKSARVLGSPEQQEFETLANELRDVPHLLVAQVTRDIENPSHSRAASDD